MKDKKKPNHRKLPIHRLLKQRSKKSGLPPGTLVHIGEQKVENVRIFVMEYDEEGLREYEAAGLGQCIPVGGDSRVTWINVEGLHQAGVIQQFGECHDIHGLVLEDILNTDQRPKLEDYDGYLFIVLKMLIGGDELKTEQVSLVLGPRYVISFQEQAGDVFDPVRARIRNGKGKIRKRGPDYLAYALIDAVVDNYFVVLEKLGERVERLEDELVSSPNEETLRTIHELKREMLFLRRAVWPLREVISGLERGESALIADSTRIYLRDVYDHTIQVIDTIETSREMLSGMLDIYLSSVSNRMNEIMKFLTIIGTLFIPLTFVVGIYGMNFQNMPELGWKYGYFAVLGLMAAIGVVLLVYFRRKKWL